jgi:L-amino acid N-acyltransferase YncA
MAATVLPAEHELGELLAGSDPSAAPSRTTSKLPGVPIRHAEPERDAAACAELYAPFVRDTVISLEETPPTASDMAGRIERVSRSYPWLIAEDDGNFTGFAYAGLHRERAAYRWSSDVTVYVAPERQRQGIGRALYTALFDLLVHQGVYVVCAGVTLPNEASVALHESLGFVPVGVYKRVAWKFGAWQDVGWWQMQLVEADPEGPGELGPPARLEDL